MLVGELVDHHSIGDMCFLVSPPIVGAHTTVKDMVQQELSSGAHKEPRDDEKKMG